MRLQSGQGRGWPVIFKRFKDRLRLLQGRQPHPIPALSGQADRLHRFRGGKLLFAISPVPGIQA